MDMKEQYWDDMERYPKRYSEKEYREFARLWQEEGDTEARNKVVEDHLRFAISVAKRYAQGGTEYLDAVQTANQALMTAVDKWDRSESAKFGTYAHYKLKEACSDLRNEATRILKLPDHKHKLLMILYKVEKDLEDKDGPVTPPEIAEKMRERSKTAKRLKFDANKVVELWELRRAQAPKSLWGPVKTSNEGWGDVTVEGTIAAPDDEPLDPHKELREAILDLLDEVLSEKKGYTLARYYGLLDGYGGETMEEIAEDVGRSKGAINDRIWRARNKLTKYVKENPEKADLLMELWG